MTFPMALTLSRLVLAPIVLAVWLVAVVPVPAGGWPAAGGPVGALSAVLVCTLAIEFTDIFDGHLARRWGQVSDAGKFLDPLADSVSRSTVFLCFLAAGYAPVWMVALVFYRESLISGLRIAGAAQNLIIAARWSGKSKAILQGIVINVLVFLDLLRAAGGYPSALPAFEPVAWWSMALVTTVTVVSAFDYLSANRKVLARLFSSPAAPGRP
jgi:CDP-diacylglycerol--glycerol-3-phosphate 3-phosphatidyltransferase